MQSKPQWPKNGRDRIKILIHKINWIFQLRKITKQHSKKEWEQRKQFKNRKRISSAHNFDKSSFDFNCVENVRIFQRNVTTKNESCVHKSKEVLHQFTFDRTIYKHTNSLAFSLSPTKSKNILNKFQYRKLTFVCFVRV